MLHITNGDSAAATIRQAGLSGTVLPWRDVLHEGPTPAGLALPAMSPVRARFLADRGWGDYADLLADFRRRDALLANCATEDEVVLWFEHDLYDQLQLLQILDWFAGRERGATGLSLICIGAFPGIARFTGLGQLDAGQIATLFPGRRPVSAAQLDLGRVAWRAVCAPDPAEITRLLAQDLSALPFLHDALVRHLEQFPAVRTGLSRTEQGILEAVQAGAREPAAIFQASQAQEERPFLGDSPFWTYLQTLSSGPDALLRRTDGGDFVLPEAAAPAAAFHTQALVLTAPGQAVRAGQQDWIAAHGIDRWVGGVHLQGHAVGWRWDAAQGRLAAASGR